MNLLNLLTGSMTSDESVQSLSGKTGIAKSKIIQLLMLALPLLLGKLTQNASNGDGALSLLGALGQHKEKRSMAEQIAEADAKDGGKILDHILGEKNDETIERLAAQTDLETGEVRSILSNIAPGLLSGLSAATDESQTQSAQNGISSGGFDLGSLFSMFGGAAAQDAQGASQGQQGGLQLLQGQPAAQPQQPSQPQQGGLQLDQEPAAEPLGGQSAAQESGLGGAGGFLDLFSSLFGGFGEDPSAPVAEPAAEQQIQQTESTAAYDGSDLLQSLLSFLH